MLTRDDVLDALAEGISPSPARVRAPGAPRAAGPRGLPPPGPKGRCFLSESDIKKRLTPDGKRLTIPGRSILSPLASDWIALRGIEIVEETASK